MNRSRFFFMLLSCLVLATPVTLMAGDAPPDSKEARKAAKRQAQQEALDAMRRGEILPLVRILAIAQQHAPGDVIEVEYKAGPKYEVKTLARDGRIREVKLDARTGALLKIEDD
ncbi:MULTISPECIES: PepSY domain-containing protein [Stenotrophomonas]|nr:MULTISPECIES: PepSY domain-containing protein [Stenotrophomonas]KQO00342.1 hypothetical protein ASF01_05160 [Stenotrophomonas sp. Leaf70]MBN8791660.1 PepSY domain-containing protein [Stenotrophomonas nitritireducens]MBN8795598.1 PepSY domain-containing protein [Stenotrophomonas nitritireducens]